VAPDPLAKPSVVTLDREGYHLELLLSDDERLLPLRLQTLDWLITATIELVEDCTNSTGCRLSAR
jgi:hypothetical protein